MSRELENLRRLESVEQVHQIQVEILLEPNDVTISAMKDLPDVSRCCGMDKNTTCLDDIRVGEDFIHVFQFIAQLKWIDNPVLLARTNLPQTHEATICAISMVFQIESDFPCLAELVYELCELGTC